MGSWYWIVGIILGGATGYIVNEKASEAKKDPGIPIIIGLGVLLLWLPLLWMAMVATLIMFGIFVGKILLRGSEGVYPKLVAIWKAFD